MKKKTLFILPLSVLMLTGCGNKTNEPTIEHEHTYSAYWAHDESYHWHEATCGHELKSDIAKHTYGEWMTIKEPTVSEKGQMMRQCSECLYCQVKDIDELKPTEKDPTDDDIFTDKKISCVWAFGDYDIDTATRPIWNSKTIYNETLTFADKNDTPSLLYTPSEILSVYDYGLETKYEEGRDFVVEGKTLKLTSNTRIRYWGSVSHDETLYMDKPGSITIQSKKYYNMTPSQTKYVFYSESIPNLYQLNVTYKTNETWNGYVPDDYSNKFVNTLNMLEKGQKINIGVLGDSITFGRGSSSDLNSYFGRNTPCYANLFYEYLTNRYPNTPIVFDNQGVGGTTASWGANTGINKLVNIPDFMVIAFGMNDDGGTADSYANNINNLVNKIHQMNAKCEILLLSPMLDNPDRLNHDCHLKQFEDRLIEIANTDDKVGVATMTSMTKYIYENTGVRFEDVNSNNYNHPNNFIHRIYAQVVLKAMLGDKFTNLK